MNSLTETTGKTTGNTLASLLREWANGTGGPDVRTVADMILQLAQALGRLHEAKVVHHGIRADRVLVEGSGKQMRCSLPNVETAPDKGADLYAEPAWAKSEGPTQDIYALGILWHQLLTRDPSRGRPGGPTWRRKLSENGAPASMLDLLESCWDDDPGQRPANGQVLAAALANHLQPAQPAPSRRPAPSILLEENTTAEAAPTRSRGRRANLDKLFNSLEQTAPERSKLITNSIGMKLVLVPEGTFQMGSPPEEPGRKANEGPVHEVQLTKPFYMGIHLVTQEQYQRVLGTNPSKFKPTEGGGFDHPVETVSWEDADTFCRRLSDLAEEKQAGRRYRLPTEAEWECACRAGTSGPFYFGALLTPAQANFDTSFPFGSAETQPPLQRTSPVGAYPPNHFGLHDMHGNVWEWCADWLDSSYYRLSPRRDPPGPASGQFRVLRGGSWRNHAITCRSAYRNGLGPRAKDMYTGFRVVLDL